MSENRTNDNSPTRPPLPLRALEGYQYDFLTIGDAASIATVSDETIRRWIDKGLPGTNDYKGQNCLLPIVRMGGTVRIHRDEFVVFLNATTVGATFYDPGYREKQ